MLESLTPIVFLIGYFVVMRFVLPKLGVPT